MRLARFEITFLLVSDKNVRQKHTLTQFSILQILHRANLPRGKDGARATDATGHAMTLGHCLGFWSPEPLPGLPALRASPRRIQVTLSEALRRVKRQVIEQINPGHEA